MLLMNFIRWWIYVSHAHRCIQQSWVCSELIGGHSKWQMWWNLTFTGQFPHSRGTARTSQWIVLYVLLQVQTFLAFFSFLNIPSYFFPLCSLIFYSSPFLILSPFLIFQLSSFLSFVIPHPSFHFSLEVWHQGSSSVFPLFLGINQGKRDNLDITWSNPCFSCCTPCPFHLCWRFKPNPFACKLHSLLNY